jgi:ABC-2 type transport system ATP-binding protein
MSPALIEAEGLTKRYGTFTAVDSLDLELQEGEIYGFLGPNGSGKTTTILMVLGLTEPSGGSVRVAGHDPAREPLAVKRMVGYLPESVGFYGDLTGRENLLYTARLNSIPRERADSLVRETLDLVELGGAVDQPVSQYSRGMRQRLGLADVLIKEPKLVILDDPTLGLDPAGIEWLLRLIQEMSRERQITIFLSSHQLHEVQRICHRVGIMSHGKLVLQGSVHELVAQQDSDGYRVGLEVLGAEAELVKALEALPGVTGVQRTGSQVVLTSSQDVRSQAARTVIAEGGELLEIRSRNQTLEEIYLRYFQED